MITIKIDNVTSGSVLSNLIAKHSLKRSVDDKGNTKQDDKGNVIYVLPSFSCKVFCGKVRDIDKAEDADITKSFNEIVNSAKSVTEKRAIVRFVDKQLITDAMNNQRGTFARGESLTTKLKKADSASDTFKAELEELLAKHSAA